MEPERGDDSSCGEGTCPSRGRELRCSGSMCRRLRFSAPAVTVSLGRRTSNKAIRCCLPTPEACGGCGAATADKPSAQETGWHYVYLGGRARLWRVEAVLPQPPGLPRTRPPQETVRPPRDTLEMHRGGELDVGRFPCRTGRVSRGKSRATRFGYWRPKPSFVQPHSSGRCGPNGRDRPAPRSYAA